MKRINVTTTLEVKDDATTEEIYDLFREDIRDTYTTGDITQFVFADADTGEEIEDK